MKVLSSALDNVKLFYQKIKIIFLKDFSKNSIILKTQVSLYLLSLLETATAQYISVTPKMLNKVLMKPWFIKGVQS